MGFLKGPKKTRHTFEFEGESVTLTFAPIRIKKIWLLGEIVATLGSTFSALFFADRGEEGRTIRNTTDADGTEFTETILTGTAPEETRQRTVDRQKVVQEAVKTLFAADNHKSLSELLLESLRFDPEFRDMAVDSFMDEIDIARVPPLLEGFIKANGEFLRPLESKIRPKMNQVFGRIKDRIEGTEEEGEEAASPAP